MTWSPHPFMTVYRLYYIRLCVQFIIIIIIIILTNTDDLFKVMTFDLTLLTPRVHTRGPVSSIPQVWPLVACHANIKQWPSPGFYLERCINLKVSSNMIWPGTSHRPLHIWWTAAVFGHRESALHSGTEARENESPSNTVWNISKFCASSLYEEMKF